MNKVYIIGRIARDLELKQSTDNQTNYLQFPIAINSYSSINGLETTNFINVVAFGRKAEVISQYLSKGRRISIEGHLNSGSYIDSNNNKKYTTDVILENFDFIDDKKQA